MARLSYLTREDVPEEHEHLFDVDADDPDDVLINVHRAMMNNPRIKEAWDDWAWTLYDESEESRIRELAILTVARVVESRYVWHQHVQPALAAGVSRDEILAINELDFEGFEPEERAVINYAIAFLRDSIDDDTHAELANFFPDSTVVALIFLISEYLQVSKVIDALAIDLETEFVGWTLDQLD